MVFDGKDVAESEDVATSATVDRLAALVTAEEGTHLVAVKVCTGALGDDGHVRLRLTDSHGAPLRLQASADLSTLPDLPPRPVARGLPGAAGARRPRGVDTLLGRVLSGRPDGRATTNVVPRLDEAVARTLGGADDSRSPRAPGLLDDLARRPELDADTLALIGWISPSGANRSSVLNRALSLAAGVDPRARAFAERRLIAQRLNSHLVDWGVATAQSTHLGKSDGEALLLNALLADALGTDALRTQALRELETFTIHQPSLAPTALLRELAHLAATYDPSQLRAAREVLAARGYRGHDLVSAMGTQSSDALAGAAKNAFDGNLEDADDGLAVADSLSRAGRHDDARAAYAQMTEWAPNRWRPGRAWRTSCRSAGRPRAPRSSSRYAARGSWRRATPGCGPSSRSARTRRGGREAPWTWTRPRATTRSTSWSPTSSSRAGRGSPRASPTWPTASSTGSARWSSTRTVACRS